MQSNIEEIHVVYECKYEYDTFATALEVLNIEIASNAFGGSLLVKFPGDTTFTTCTDPILNKIRLTLKGSIVIAQSETDTDGKFYNILKKDFYDLVGIHADNNVVNPLLDFAHSLDKPEVSSESIDNYDTIADTIFETLFHHDFPEQPMSPDEKEIHRRYERHKSRFLALAPLERSLFPERKIDEMLIIQGDQGVGKDSAIIGLWGKFVNDSVHFSMKPRELLEASDGTAVFLVSDFAIPSTRRSINNIKSMLTKGRDTSRMVYDRLNTTLKRLAVWMGTTNERRPLPNDDENRRFIVKSLTGGSKVGDIREWMKNNRDEIIGTALVMLENGASASLPRDLIEYQRNINKPLANVDDDILGRYSKIFSEFNPYGPVLKMDEEYTMDDFYSAAGMLDERDTHKKSVIRNALIEDGWVAKNRRVGEGRTTRVECWTNPHAIEEAKMRGTKRHKRSDVGNNLKSYRTEKDSNVSNLFGDAK